MVVNSGDKTADDIENTSQYLIVLKALPSSEYIITRQTFKVCDIINKYKTIALVTSINKKENILH